MAAHGARLLVDEQEEEQDEEQEQDGPLWQAVIRQPTTDRQRAVRLYILLAVNAVLFLFSLALYLRTVLLQQRKEAAALPPCVHRTDMEDARSAIEYEEQDSTGALVYDPDTKTAGRRQDAEVDYFGPPSLALDRTWHQLLHATPLRVPAHPSRLTASPGELPIMTDEEAIPYLPELLRIPKTNAYHFEPDVFHTLHCLNAVRLEVSKSLYNTTHASSHHSPRVELPDGWDVSHMEHCLDRLRQSVMCHGDLTASPLYYWEGFNLALGRTGKRTCRKWEPIRKWMDERGKRGKVLDSF
ncbi:hypothetical protein BST61_g3706 [Cercospora zeina]